MSGCGCVGGEWVCEWVCEWVWVCTACITLMSVSL